MLPWLHTTRLLPVPWAAGKKHGITELHPDVVSYVSHATQQRLQNLVERISETAQQKNFSYKVACRERLRHCQPRPAAVAAPSPGQQAASRRAPAGLEVSLPQPWGPSLRAVSRMPLTRVCGF